MRVYIATNKQAGQSWWYGRRRVFGRTEYTGDILIESDDKPTWHPTLEAARIAAEARGAIDWVMKPGEAGAIGIASR